MRVFRYSNCSIRKQWKPDTYARRLLRQDKKSACSPQIKAEIESRLRQLFVRCDVTLEMVGSLSSRLGKSLNARPEAEDSLQEYRFTEPVLGADADFMVVLQVGVGRGASAATSGTHWPARWCWGGDSVVSGGCCMGVSPSVTLVWECRLVWECDPVAFGTLGSQGWCRCSFRLELCE